MLVLDPIYLCLLSGAFGGGDVNGILYLMPQAWIWTIFAFILLFNNCSKNSLTSIGDATEKVVSLVSQGVKYVKKCSLIIKYC